MFEAIPAARLMLAPTTAIPFVSVDGYRNNSRR
jgi:hypothetical protein